MSTHRPGDIISLWGDDNGRKRRTVTLRNRKDGKFYSFVLKRVFTVGRSRRESNLQITTEDRYISGKHVSFINESDGVYVEDLCTKNGTRLNGRPVTTRVRIYSGDILKMGKTEFEVTF